MFGPDSGRGSWQGLNFMYESVRVGRSPDRQQRVKNLLKVSSCGLIPSQDCSPVLDCSPLTCSSADYHWGSTGVL